MTATTSDTLNAHLEQNAAAQAGLAERIRESGVELVYYQFVTLNGRVMAKVAPARHLARNLERGVQFHGVGGRRPGDQPPRHADRQPARSARSSWRSRTRRPSPCCRGITIYGRFFCDLYTRRDRAEEPGEPLPTCVRGNLARVHQRFAERTGLELRSGTEPEMSWLGEDVEVWSQPNVSPAYHIGALETMRPIVKRVIAYAQAMGLDMIEGDYEDTGQLELNFQFDRCERTCDRLVTYRQICAQVAREFGVIASFMPKPAVGLMANGCHHNLSLWRGDENVFVDEGNGTLHVSETARHALGGILEHSRGMLALLAPTVNSYARYWDVGAVRAGRLSTGDFDNRTCAVRVSASGRLEYKLPDASVNPFISHAAVLEAIADGLERGSIPALRSPRTRTADSSRTACGSPRCRGRWATHWPRWPRTRWCAARSRRAVRRVLEYKTDEWERFCGTVTEWHREMYLRALP